MMIVSTWQKATNIMWLGLGIVFLLLTFVLWILFSTQKGVKEVPIEIEIQQTASPVRMQTIAFNEQIGMLNEEVPPLDVTKREVAVGEHETEFRGSKFLAEHQTAWTLQLMKVTEEDIIRAYLAKREDRKKFQYFRLQDKKNPIQFVLTYGVFKNVKQTIDEAENLNLALPESVKIIPEKFSTYQPLVNDLGHDELSTGTKLRAVILTKAALPKIVDLMPKAETKTMPNVLAGTTTTIQRKDESGEVKSTHVERSNPAIDTPAMQQKMTSPASGASSTEKQVVDPF